ncbi:MAG: hypothetical protein AB1393_05140 [Candidatus Edwardsbacteria bacterium]
MKEIARDYKLVPIDEFDARRGYSRWLTPGVGIRSTKRGSLAQADLWIDQEGKLVARFTSRGYSLHFQIRAVSSDLAPVMKDHIEEFLTEMLMTWVVDGVDDDLECDAVESCT